MSDSNQIIVYIGEETASYGTPRSDIGGFYKLGVTSISLKKNRSAHPSAELREDRNVADFRLGTTEVSGDIACELKYDTNTAVNMLIRSVMRRASSETIAGITRTDISASSVDNSLNTVAGVMPLLDAGDTFLISGFTGTVGNNRYATVVSRTELKIVISGITLVTEAAGESVTIAPQVEVYTPGKRSDGIFGFGVERRFADVEGVSNYHYFSGCNVNSMNVKVPADGLCTATFGLMGKDLEEYDSVSVTAEYNESALSRPTDGYSGTVTIDGTENATITELDFTINNNMAARHVIGTPLTQDHTLGQVNITGNMTAFFGSDDSNLLGLFLAETPVSLRKTVIDPDGNRIEFRFPRIFFTGGGADSNGVSGEVTTSLPFQAVYDATAGYALQIRFNRKPTA